VLWVNTIGTRPPKLNWATMKRAAGKVMQWSQSPKAAPAEHQNLLVLNPRMWPGFGRPWQRQLNASLIIKYLKPILAELSEPAIAITTIPIVADIMSSLPVKSWHYYCVDDFSVWPGLDGVTLGTMEKQMLPGTNGIIAASEHLQNRLQLLGYSSSLLTHGVDLPFWTNPTNIDGLELVKEIERPLIVFWGVIDKRMDIAFLPRLTADLKNGTVVLAGPQDEPHAELATLPRTKLLGPLPLEQLPALAQQADVLIMPYADLPVTQAMQPLKLKEYLATGKPVVVRNLPANRDWHDCLDLVNAPEEFSRRVMERLATGVPIDQANARQRLEHESWTQKAALFSQLIKSPQPLNPVSTR
jgi:glycosyltransferase involved in cell wall biosynthesis